jgi:uncharacterized RDD family membrane protein YckC
MVGSPGEGGALSEMNQGPGWWLASDDRWYPPHLHPSVMLAPPPPVPPPPVPYPFGYGPPGGNGNGVRAAADRLDPGQVRDAALAVVLASWWKRFVAILVDSMILAMCYLLAIALIVAVAGHHGTASPSTPNHGSGGAGSVVLAIVVAYVLFSIPLALYYGIMNGSRRGQTVGKMALGIAVRDARSGQRIGFWRGVGRYFITVLFALVLLVPYLLDNLAPLWNGRNQAWHDRVAHSVVVDLGATRAPRP